MMTTLILCLSAGVALGLAFNVFALLALTAAFALVCVVASIGLGAVHPLAATLSCLCVMEIGYAVGLFLLAYSPRWSLLIGRKKLRAGRR